MRSARGKLSPPQLMFCFFSVMSLSQVQKQCQNSTEQLIWQFVFCINQWLLNCIFHRYSCARWHCVSICNKYRCTVHVFRLHSPLCEDIDTAHLAYVANGARTVLTHDPLKTKKTVVEFILHIVFGHISGGETRLLALMRSEKENGKG